MNKSYFDCMILSTAIIIAICIFFFCPKGNLYDYLKKKRIQQFYHEKFEKHKPTDRQKITSNDLTGNVESIHPWGRTEIVPMKNVELEYFEYCDEWVMGGDIIQPIGRKDYFMPIMRGRLDLNVNEMIQTWIEYGSYATSPEEKAETYEDFRMAHILIKKGRVINIKYTHYRLDSDKSWSIIASWGATFNENIQRRN